MSNTIIKIENQQNLQGPEVISTNVTNFTPQSIELEKRVVWCQADNEVQKISIPKKADPPSFHNTFM